MQAQRERKILDWELTKLEAQLKYTISDYNEIEEVCTWERRQKDPTISFNMDLYKEKEPEEYKKYLKSKKGSVLPKLELTRPYPANWLLDIENSGIKQPFKYLKALIWAYTRIRLYFVTLLSTYKFLKVGSPLF